MRWDGKVSIYAVRFYCFQLIYFSSCNTGFLSADGINHCLKARATRSLLKNQNHSLSWKDRVVREYWHLSNSADVCPENRGKYNPPCYWFCHSASDLEQSNLECYEQHWFINIFINDLPSSGQTVNAAVSQFQRAKFDLSLNALDTAGHVKTSTNFQLLQQCTIHHVSFPFRIQFLRQL